MKDDITTPHISNWKRTYMQNVQDLVKSHGLVNGGGGLV